MISVFKDLKKGKYCHTVSKALEKKAIQVCHDNDEDDFGGTDDVDDDICTGKVVDVESMPGGELHESEHDICLDQVPIITPCGDVVVSKLSFEVYTRFKVQFTLELV